MCGRFAASASTDLIVDAFAVDVVVNEVVPSWNAAPTDPVPAVVERFDRESGQAVRKLVTPRWGLVPSWSKGPSGAARMINARAETVAIKPSFRAAFAARRCLIPSDGFYEWHVGDAARPGARAPRQPWFIRPRGGGWWVMAGIYEFWRDRTASGPQEWLVTCAIITTTASDAVGRIHDRMPTTIRPDDWADWLDPGRTDPDNAQGLLHVAGDDELESYRVSMRVNDVRQNTPDLLEPLTG